MTMRQTLSPALHRRDWLEGYASGSLPWPKGTYRVARELRVIELACNKYTQEALTGMAFTHGFLAGLVALWCGVALVPPLCATSIKPYSKETT